MTSRETIKNLARLRWKEAKLLFDNDFFDGAYYLGGYCIELSIKAAICKTLDLDNFFDESTPLGFQREIKRPFKIHDFENLIILSGLWRKFDDAKAMDSQLFKDWSVIKLWSENCRYNYNTRKKEDVLSFLDAIYRETPQSGFMTWMKNNW
jgi:hypothetical protein